MVQPGLASESRSFQRSTFPPGGSGFPERVGEIPSSLPDLPPRLPDILLRLAVSFARAPRVGGGGEIEDQQEKVGDALCPAGRGIRGGRALPGGEEGPLCARRTGRTSPYGGRCAQAALATMRKMSPTSLKVTLRNVRDAARFHRLEESFQQDFRIALACIAGHDFIEGIRAQIVDKDRNPRWRPATLEGVTAEIVGRHFKSVGGLELHFAD